MKTAKVYKQIENRIKVFGLSYTALKILALIEMFPIFFFVYACTVSFLMAVLTAVFIGAIYLVVLLLDSTRIIQSLSDQKIDKHIINDRITHASTQQTQPRFKNRG